MLKESGPAWAAVPRPYLEGPPMNESPDPRPLRAPRRPGCWGAALAEHQETHDWLVPGYLARRQLTLLTSQWKTGKTTLLANLLARMKAGGELAGLPVTAARAVVVSEESELHWCARQKKFDLGHVFFFCRPFAGKPDHAEWCELLGDIGRMARSDGVGLAAIDTLATFLPAGSENQSDAVLRALVPVLRLAEAGVAVLLTHHPRKGTTAPGQAFRGSGAFGGVPDIVVEMSACPRANPDDRRRRLLGFSRNAETPRQLVLELNADGTDYRNLGDFEEDEFLASWERLRPILEAADGKLTRAEILRHWPPGCPRPADTTLWGWLKRAAALGLVCQEGGKKGDPQRYWLPSREAVWRQDPLWQLEQQTEEARRATLEALNQMWKRP